MSHSIKLRQMIKPKEKSKILETKYKQPLRDIKLKINVNFKEKKYTFT